MVSRHSGRKLLRGVWLALLLAASTASGFGVSAAELPPAPEGEVTISDEARKRFTAGVGFLQDPDGARYEPALAEFLAAYRASASWKILGNLGLCALKLERHGLAIEAYERYLAQGGSELDADEKRQVTRDLELLRAGSAPITITVRGAEGQVEILDRRVRADGSQSLNRYLATAGAPLELVVHAGQHEITARTGAGTTAREARYKGTLEPRKPESIELVIGAAGPVADARGVTTGQASDDGGLSGLQLGGVTTAGVGVAAVVAGLITGAIGSSKLGDLEAACPGDVCPTERRGDVDSIESLQTTTNILLIAGGSLAATGLGLVLFGGDSSGDGKAARAAPFQPSRVTLGAAPGPGGAGVWMTGHF